MMLTHLKDLATIKERQQSWARRNNCSFDTDGYFMTVSYAKPHVSIIALAKIAELANLDSLSSVMAALPTSRDRRRPD
jgi:hypothetical protein